MIKNLFPVLFVALFASCSEDVQHKCIAPLPAPYSLEALTDATVLASFSKEHFNWEECKLTFSVYSVDLYDAVEISQMIVGDTLVYNGDKMIIQDIKDENGTLTINNGLYEGGACLIPGDGGTYRAILDDDYATYTHIGDITLPFVPDFTFIDCGNDYHDPNDTITSAHKEQIESRIHLRFDYLNTNVRIESGKITNITRRWTP